MARSDIIQISDNFWNIRGSFKIAKLLDIGTHVSLIKRSNGKFLFLDSYTFSAAAKAKINQLTNNGRDVEAVLNLHPFHTVHVKNMHKTFPQAKLYGTSRHVANYSELPWEKQRTEDPELHSMFAGDLEFSVPRGVDFISANENIHFSSVLALHRSSKTIHVDDTLMYFQLPLIKNWFELPASLRFHPTLAQALEKRAGAADDFRQWAEELSEQWREAENLCAAHTAPLIMNLNKGASIHERMLKALRNVKLILAAHEKWYG
ncbi:MAG: hypothetical protein HKN85_11865 [Gammaproteobacteria bacterium]|nr:hypothetical protein [Gammaproteobacteria bacterium]